MGWRHSPATEGSGVQTSPEGNVRTFEQPRHPLRTTEKGIQIRGNRAFQLCLSFLPGCVPVNLCHSAFWTHPPYRAFQQEALLAKSFSASSGQVDKRRKPICFSWPQKFVFLRPRAGLIKGKQNMFLMSKPARGARRKCPLPDLKMQ